MTRISNTSTLAIFAGVALFAAAAGLWLAHLVQGRNAKVAESSVVRDGPLLVLPESKPIADFTLYDHSGQDFSRASLAGHWTLVFFGFSNCPHVCPDTLFRLKGVVDKLKPDVSPAQVPRILFVGVDPERDTPEALGRYRDRFDDAIEAVSGSDDQLRALATQLGVHYLVPDHDPGTWYSVEHSITVALLDPEVRWVGLFSPPHEPGAMAAALERLLGGRPGHGAPES